VWEDEFFIIPELMNRNPGRFEVQRLGFYVLLPVFSSVIECKVMTDVETSHFMGITTLGALRVQKMSPVL